MGKTLGSLLIAALFLAGCAEFTENFIRPDKGPIGQKHAPVLEAIWAQPEIGENEMWKVYVRAHDPDGDLDKVFIGFHQPGAVWSPDFLILHKSQRKKANGAVLYWTFIRGFSSIMYVQVNVRVEDRAGNMSETRSIELELTPLRKKDAANPPAGFAKNVLFGTMDFPIRAITSTGGDAPAGG